MVLVQAGARSEGEFWHELSHRKITLGLLSLRGARWCRWTISVWQVHIVTLARLLFTELANKILFAANLLQIFNRTPVERLRRKASGLQRNAPR
jgi:hypothetical protein